MRKSSRVFALAASFVIAAGCMAGCGSKDNGSNGSASGSDFDTSNTISVVSREDGSGTRGAFVELTGVEEKNSDGKKVDMTTDEAIISNSTEIMMTTVAGDDYAIGYASLGSVNDTIKALNVDGVEATAENVSNGKYTLARPFNIVTSKSGVSAVAQDFINFIMSDDGQKIISDNKYIEVDFTGAFESDKSTGSIVVAGSSSVTPVMEKLAEAYKKVNSGAEIEIQESDSTTGVTNAINGTCDIGMASRDLKDTESKENIEATAIAMDGIAVIVNKNNTLDDITTDQIAKIFKGEVTTWDEVK